MTIAPTKTRLLRQMQHSRSLLGCRFDPSGRFLFAASQDHTIQRFDLITGQATALVGHESWVRGLAFVGTSAPPVPQKPIQAQAALGGALPVSIEADQPVEPFFVISGDYAGNLIWWEGHVAAPKPIRMIAAHDGWIRGVAVSPTGCLAASCGNDHLVKLWNTADGKLLHTFTGHDNHVYAVAFHPDRTRLVTADLHGNVKDWNAHTGQLVRDLDAKLLHKYDEGFRAHIGGIRGIDFDRGGMTLACAGITNVSNAFAGVGNPGIVLLDWLTGKPRQLNPKDAYQGTAWGIHLHPDGFAIAAGGNADGRIWFWNLADGAPVHAMGIPSTARDLAIHPDGTAFAVASHNGVAAVYTML